MSKYVGRETGKSVFQRNLRYDGEAKSHKVVNSQLPRKDTITQHAPVPQTDTGRREENSKTRGRTFVKELGKMIP